MDFCAGWASGFAGIVIGNPLDILKVRMQAGQEGSAKGLLASDPGHSRLTSLVRGQYGNGTRLACQASIETLEIGVTAPAVAYGALNALLFVSYNRVLLGFDPAIKDPLNVPHTEPWKIWAAGAAGGLAIWAVSAPSELIKCQAQLAGEGSNSWSVTRDIYKQRGIAGLYRGGTVTSLRDSIGYGF